MKKICTIAIDMGGGKSSCVWYEDASPTLTTTHYGEPVVVVYEEDCGRHLQPEDNRQCSLPNHIGGGR